jgi:outer membrane lipoprotein SlyB
MHEQSVRMGTVESVRNVTIANPESGVGTMTGAALGGLAGSKSAAARARSPPASSAPWPAACSASGSKPGQQPPGFEITVHLENGELRAITQPADEMFRPGERVRLVSNGYIDTA